MRSNAKAVQSYNVSIHVGFRVGRTLNPCPTFHTLQEAERICQGYCNDNKLCVTVTPTKFVYTGGKEDGCTVGLINYPRFPKDFDVIRDHAFALGRLLLDGLEQMVVSVVTPEYTYLIEGELRA